MKPIVLASVLILAGCPALAQAAPGGAAANGAQAGSSVANAATDSPSATAILFEAPQLKNAAPGSVITYDYLRRSGITKGPYGPPLNDEIKLTIEPGSADDNRTVQIQMFTGSNRTPAGPFANMPTNPVILLFLENHLKGLAGLLEANPRYLKNAIRKGLRENATVSATQVDFKGKKVDGWRIETKPFVGDAQTERMRGFESLTYTFVTSAQVPGEIVSISAQAKNPEGGELLEESVNYDQDAS